MRPVPKLTAEHSNGYVQCTFFTIVDSFNNLGENESLHLEVHRNGQTPLNCVMTGYALSEDVTTARIYYSTDARRPYSIPRKPEPFSRSYAPFVDIPVNTDSQNKSQAKVLLAKNQIHNFVDLTDTDIEVLP